MSSKLSPSQIADVDNRRRLAASIERWEGKVVERKARLDALIAQASDLDPVALAAAEASVADAEDRLHARREVLGALTRVENDGPPECPRPLFIDFQDRETAPIRAAVSVGNPDDADRIAVAIPGVGSTAARSLNGMVYESTNLNRECREQAATVPELANLKIAIIAWMGYEPPPNAVDTKSVRDTIRTLLRSRAIRGSRYLADFLSRLRKQNPDARIIVLGHSYGSLTSSLAIQRLRGTDVVNTVIFMGSPGLGIAKMDQLAMPEGQVYVMRGRDDIIASPGLAEYASWHGFGRNPYTIGIPELSASPGPDAQGYERAGVNIHADYLRTERDNSRRLRMSGYNCARVIVGLEPIFENHVCVDNCQHGGSPLAKKLRIGAFGTLAAVAGTTALVAGLLARRHWRKRS